ncbi:MAG: DUF3990 domain-containing protein [Synergistaceae bacterium]|nr:DUF3990 domain-containing protein [Synergistaceae bacterium]
MRLYHGTTLEIPTPMIIVREIGRDFGLGFYTTSIREQAERWAVRRARIASRKIEPSARAIVNVYGWDESADLKIKRFEGTSMEWLDLVVRCRSDKDHVHGYDVVIGKIADDDVGETVSFVVQGIMRREDAIERLKFQRINDQIAFCTERALRTLTFSSAYEVEDRTCTRR